MDVDVQIDLLLVNVPNAERICGVGRCQFMHIESLEFSPGLLVEDRIPLSVDHIADLHLVLAG